MKNWVLLFFIVSFPLASHSMTTTELDDYVKDKMEKLNKKIMINRDVQFCMVKVYQEKLLSGAALTHFTVRCDRDYVSGEVSSVSIEAVMTRASEYLVARKLKAKNCFVSEHKVAERVITIKGDNRSSHDNRMANTLGGQAKAESVESLTCVFSKY